MTIWQFWLEMNPRSVLFFSFARIALLRVLAHLWATIQDAIPRTSLRCSGSPATPPQTHLGPTTFMTSQIATSAPTILADKRVFYNRFLLIVAGLGGLLYGVDVGIIAGALPYLEATSGFSAQQLSIVVARGNESRRACNSDIAAGWKARAPVVLSRCALIAP